jgi:hypothetical protein
VADGLLFLEWPGPASALRLDALHLFPSQEVPLVRLDNDKLISTY